MSHHSQQHEKNAGGRLELHLLLDRIQTSHFSPTTSHRHSKRKLDNAYRLAHANDTHLLAALYTWNSPLPAPAVLPMTLSTLFT